MNIAASSMMDLCLSECWTSVQNVTSGKKRLLFHSEGQLTQDTAAWHWLLFRNPVDEENVCMILYVLTPRNICFPLKVYEGPQSQRGKPKSQAVYTYWRGKYEPRTNIGSRLNLAFHSFKVCCVTFQMYPVSSSTLQPPQAYREDISYFSEDDTLNKMM